MDSSRTPWPTKRDDYEILQVIGCGATSVVQEALCKTINEKCAIKRIDLEKCAAQFDEILKELQLMSQNKHENVASFHTAFVVKDELWLVMQLMDGGSLLDILKNLASKGLTKNGCLDEIIIATVLKETLTGLNYIHQNHLLHRDVKAGNILLSSNGSIKVADFGVSSWLYEGGDTSRKQRKTFVGTPCWMAPEVMEQVSGYDSKADIWSVGILALELATGHAPYAKFPPMKALMLTLQNDPPTLELCGDLNHDDYKKYSKMFRKFVDSCLQKDADARLTAAELLKTEFIKKKAKGKEFLMQHLVPMVANIKDRSQKVRRVAGTSGRLHRTEDGAWEWSDDEFSGPVDEEEGEKSPRVLAPRLQLTQPTLQPSEDKLTEQPSEQMSEQTRKLEEEQEELKRQFQKQQEEFQHKISALEQQKRALKLSSATGLPQTEKSDASQPEPAASHTEHLPEALQLALKIRNAQNKLKDIKFMYSFGKDSAGGVADELVSAGLVNAANCKAVTDAIEQLVTNMPSDKKTIFQLVANPNGGKFETTDKVSLVGFAQLTVL